MLKAERSLLGPIKTATGGGPVKENVGRWLHNAIDVNWRVEAVETEWKRRAIYDILNVHRTPLGESLELMTKTSLIARIQALEDIVMTCWNLSLNHISSSS